MECAAVQKLARPPFPNFHPPFQRGEVGERTCIWTHVTWKCSCCCVCHIGGGVCCGGVKIKIRNESLFCGLLHAIISMRQFQRRHREWQLEHKLGSTVGGGMKLQSITLQWDSFASLTSHVFNALNTNPVTRESQETS